MHLQFQNVSYDGGASRSSGLVGRKNPQLEQISLSKHFFFFLIFPAFLVEIKNRMILGQVLQGVVFITQRGSPDKLV